MSSLELSSLPRFEGHVFGTTPSCVLYVKNLGKGVEESDLRYVFGAFVREREMEELKVSHMAKGRMRGQAFITFPRVEAAMAALQACHGVVLEGKPMILAYGNGSRSGMRPSSEEAATLLERGGGNDVF